MSGNYKATQDTISFGPVAATKMFCANSQEMEFAALLEDAKRYHFTSKGEPVFESDSALAAFR